MTGTVVGTATRAVAAAPPPPPPMRMPEPGAWLYGVGTTETTIRGHVRAAPFHLCEGVEPMGRGRAKAKQTKVARELKYSSPSTDYDALQRELGANGGPEPPGARAVEDVDEELEDDALAGSDDERWAPRR